jgi:hypothetical protein
MLMYWVFFTAFALAALTQMRPVYGDDSTRKSRLAWSVTWFFLAVWIGLRHEVGGDWFTYLEHLEQIKDAPFLEFPSHGDPAYALLNWFGANVVGGVYLVNFCAALLFSWGLVQFCREQPRPWLALLVAAPYLITVVAMGYTRQGVAIGLVMLGLVSFNRGSTARFLLWIALAALFHKSAVVLAPMAIFAGSKRAILNALGVLLVAALLFVSLLQESVDALMTNYIEAEYESSGAAIRVTMNALPAMLFLMFRKRMRLSQEAQNLWTWTSLGALGFVFLLIVSPSSTAVDRVALYWIPLQLFVWTRIPDVMGRFGERNPFWVWLILAYSTAVLFVWLFFATHAFAWLPYQFYPLEWLLN